MTEPGRTQMTTRPTRIAYGINKTTKTQSEYINLLLSIEKWLHKRESLLCYIYNACSIDHFFPTVT